MRELPNEEDIEVARRIGGIEEKENIVCGDR